LPLWNSPLSPPHLNSLHLLLEGHWSSLVRLQNFFSTLLGPPMDVLLSACYAASLPQHPGTCMIGPHTVRSHTFRPLTFRPLTFCS
jgi:hypothetical protein